MANKKTVRRKRKKSTTRRSEVKATDSASASSGTTVDETLEQEKGVTVKGTGAAKARKRRYAAKPKKTTRRPPKKDTPAAESGGAAEPTAPDAQATVKAAAAADGSAKPAAARKKRARQRRGREPRRSETVADRKTATKTPPPPRVKPVSPAAEVEQNEDMIVIRFPSAAPLSGPASRAPTAEKGPARAKDVAGSEAIPDDAAMEPPIDWEVAEQSAEVSDDREAATELPGAQDDSDAGATAAAPVERLTNADARKTPPDGADKTPEPPTRKDEVVSARPKRRRRRKKKDPRLTPKQETSQDDRPETREARQRREPVGQPAKAVEPAAEEKPTRRRRRRARRGRSQEEEAATAEAKDEVGDEAEAEPEGHAERSKAAAPLGQKEMIINVVPREECRIAIMEKGKLQEIYLERASAENYVGNIYKGIVTNVEPSIQAAFVDFGQGKNGFLHISDLHPQCFPDGEGNAENVGRKMPRRNRPPIQRCLRRGQQLLVQITKEGIGTKGPTLTAYLSIPGRFLVMMPGMRQIGVSRKIEDDEARHKLRKQLLDLALPEDIGFIARTAALDRTKRELQSDLNYLSRLWKAVQTRIANQKAPAEIYTESDLVIRTIRDVYTSDISRIVVDDHDVATRAHEFLSIFSPRSRDTVVEYDQTEPIFHRYGIEAELERLHSRHVPLKSGGSLVIDQTEALVAVDVNSGRFRTEDDA
ncbi:MAG: ribonuclease E/G, partial [Phycisphaerae bacterium]